MKSLPIQLLAAAVASLLAFGIAMADVPTTSAHASASGVTQNSDASPAFRVGDDQSAIALRMQIAEMRRGEDRLLSTVHWSLAIVVSIAIGLAAFSWWSSNKLHQQDLQRVKEDLHRQLSETVSKQLSDATSKLSLGQEAKLTRLHADANAYTMWQVSQLRLQIGDFAGSISAALEQASIARISNANYIVHAVDRFVAALDAATERNCRLAEDQLLQLRSFALEPTNSLGKRSKELLAAVDRNEKS